MLREAFATVVCGALLSFPCATWAGNEAAALVIATERDRSNYQMGERIPIDLSFTGSPNKQFEITMAGYDRSGRMRYEEFEVEPRSGWSDPLAVYFGSQGGFIGGGLSTLGVLSPKPTVMHLNLNEWVRFDQPGSYTVAVTSHRVSDNLDASRRVSRASDFTLKSNPIQLNITPATSSWQRAKLETIVNELSTNPETPGIQPPAREAAIADLRYLGTPAAAQVMAQHLRDDEPTMIYQCAFGLIGLAEAVHPQAIAAMNRLIGDPNFPVSGWFITTLTTLQIEPDSPGKQLAERVRLSNLIWQSVVSALPAKTGSARAATVQTLLDAHPAEMTQQTKTELSDILKVSLLDLPAEKQISVLRSDWNLIESPGLLPALQQLAKKPLKNPGSNEFNSYTTRELKSIALERWYQFDPDGARQEAIRQIGSAHPSLTAEALQFLGSVSLPQFESLWADAFMDATEYQQETVFASLLAHFGTGDALAIVREKAETRTGEWPCAPQGAALAYLVKFDPASARPLVERAVQARGLGKTACNHSVFQDIGKYSHDPMLREVALETLDDPDPQVTQDALIYLTNYGEASDEEPISHRYTQWSRKWQGRPQELDARETGSLAGNWQEIGLGENLAFALIANQGWLASEKLILSTVEQCVGEQMCQTVNQLAVGARTIPYSISAYREGEIENYEIAQYSSKSLELLDAKIAQFPKGSRFVITNDTADNEEQNRLNSRVKDLLAQHGMVLDRGPQN